MRGRPTRFPSRNSTSGRSSPVFVPTKNAGSLTRRFWQAHSRPSVAVLVLLRVLLGDFLLRRLLLGRLFALRRRGSGLLLGRRGGGFRIGASAARTRPRPAPPPHAPCL